jgi:ferrous iron transport protein A
MTLDNLKIGFKGIIKEINIVGGMKRRLLDIGLVKGTIVESVLKSPSGDPIAYSIRGAMIAVRREDSRNVVIEII